MASSEEILNQLTNQYQNPGAIANQIEQSIKDAYSPGIKTLIDEGNALRAPAQTAYFDEFAKAGHTAGDASAASLLSSALTSANNAYSPYATNLGLRDYYNTNVNNMVQKAQGLFNSGLGALKDQYSMLYQREQDAKANELAQAQLELQRQAARRAASGGGGFSLGLGGGVSNTQAPTASSKAKQIVDSYKNSGVDAATQIQLHNAYPDLTFEEARQKFLSTQKPDQAPAKAPEPVAATPAPSILSSIFNGINSASHPSFTPLKF